MRTITHFVGLDVHKDSIVIAVAPAEGGEPRCLGTIPNDWTKLRNRLRKIGAADSLAVCYEAGPMGYPLHRRLVGAGIEASVIAPSLIPRAPGDRVKTDRRDALALARFFRSGDLTPVRVPDEQTEAVRDLTRAREDAKAAGPPRFAHPTSRAHGPAAAESFSSSAQSSVSENAMDQDAHRVDSENTL